MTPHHDRQSERGAILVFVAIALLMLTAFLVFVIDYGIMWVGRSQAQNAADAGALAGAVARAYDDLDNPPASDGPAAMSAEQAAELNPIWGEAGVAQVSWACPTGVAGACVRVDAYRNGQFGSTPLVTVLGPVLNINSQGVRATATARVATGNATNCMRPWAIPDKWLERNPGPGSRGSQDSDQYDRWRKKGSSAVLLDPADEYVPPSSTSAGSGYTVTNDFGAEVTLKNGNPNSNNEAVKPGWFLPIRLPDGNGGYISGGDDYRDAIATCIGSPVTIGQYLPLESGAMIGPTGQGVTLLEAQDDDAYWDGEDIADSCAPTCAPISPRIVPLTVFDMDEFQWRREQNDWTSPWGSYPANPCPAGGRCIRVANILGFFVDRMDGNDVIGYLMTYPGEFVLGAPAVGGGAAFLQFIQLVR